VTKAVIISNGLDTNGQNARFVRAAQKHGDHPAILNALAIGQIDPGGVVGRLRIAADKHPEAGLTIRSYHRHQQYFEFPGGQLWDRRSQGEIRLYAREADVIHFNNSDIAARTFDLYQKPLLLHHHGSMFRNNPQRMLDIAAHRKMIQAVSTIDLQRPAPEKLYWLPTAYDVAALRTFGLLNDRSPDGRIRIVHCPTNRALKHTDLFLQAVSELLDEGLPIDLVMVENQTNEVAMAEKAKADIVYDQLMFGYGCNSVEAWAMGKPVIAGADDWTLRRMRSLWGGLPFQPATSHSLKGVIRKMVQSADMRDEAAQRGVAHVLKYHDELPALEILAQLYRDAITLRHKPRIHGKGVLFQSRKRALMVDGQRIEFNGGQAVVTDEVVVERLRRTIKQRPLFGVEEVA